jgi:parvulin-like peptidyl-prolyl isomerase
LAKNKEENKPREQTRRQISHAKKQALRQKIYLFGGITVVAAVIILAIAGWLFGEYLPMNKTVVQVYDEKISEADLIDTLVFYGASQTGIDIAQNMDYILQIMVQNMLEKRAAAGLGITVSDQEISDAVDGADISQGQKELIRASLLQEKLRSDYFDKQVPDSGNQVLMNAMLVESAEIVPGIRDRLMSGDNFSILADEYALNTVSKDNHGVFDWHPQSILQSDLGAAVPVDWAFSENAAKGDISDALSDNVSSKMLGYWLIRVNEKPAFNTDNETSANVSALLLSSKEEALKIKSQLEAGDDLAALADKFSQYSPSQQGHGQLIAVESDNISTPFNDFAFNPDTTLGQWSDPIQDTRYGTKGGAWIVQIVDKSDNHPYSADDKDSLVNAAYSTWIGQLWTESTTEIKYTLDEPERTLAIDRATRKIRDLLQSYSGY